MSRLKTIGFEQDTLAANSEIHAIIGNPAIITNINPNTNLAYVWDSATDTWDSLVVPWPVTTSDALFEAGGVHGGYKAAMFHLGDQIQIPASIKNGGAYFRAYSLFNSFPSSQSNNLLTFNRSSDNKAMVELNMNTDGSLSLAYRLDATPAGTDATVIGSTAPLNKGQYYRIEFAVVGDQGGTTRLIQALVDGEAFATATISGLSATDGYMTIGELDIEAGDYEVCIDDIAINDVTGSHNNGYPGEGFIVLLPVTADDDVVGTFSRGGTNTGADWSQVDDASPPDDTSYLIGTAGQSVDLRTGNPYEAGLNAEDTVNVVTANFRWKMAGAGNADINIYLRAGSGLPLQGRVVNTTGTSWFTGDPNGMLPDPFSSQLMPQSSMVWTVEELSAARIGMAVNDSTSNIQVSSLWVQVEYVPYTAATNHQIIINGVDRSNDVVTGTMDIVDILFDQANTAQFNLEDIHGVGIPVTGQTVQVSLNGVILFGGLVTKCEADQLSNTKDVMLINCIDYTRLLDRRLVATTYNNMLDSDIINEAIAQFASGQGITTYHVSPGVTVAQISENYVQVSQFLSDLCTYTGRFWYMDYLKDIHYFPMDQNQAPFDILPTGAQYTNLQTIKDDSQLRNRVYVKGGTTTTTNPYTEHQIADGVQTTFLLSEIPIEPFTMTVAGVHQSVGIENVDDPTLFNFMLNDVQKYVKVGNASTPSAGQNMAFTYNYQIPVLISIEDTNSVAAEGAYEFAIIDQTIGSTQAARDRASAELTDYAKTLVTATYDTEEKGLRSGMTQTINLPNKGINEQCVISQVEAVSVANGLYVYTVQLTNAKTLGIIKFLKDMLKINKTVGTFDANASVDGLLTVIDSLAMSDSLMDSMGGAAAKWSNDAGTTTNKARWSLYQWQ